MRRRTKYLSLCLIFLASACAKLGDEAKPDSAANAAKAPGNAAPAGALRVKRVSVPVDNAPTSGERSAPVTLVAFTDFQCPYCVRAMATVAQLQKQYGDKLRVVMHQRPLPMHDKAREAALAAIGAQLQGKYWAMQDKLFANSHDLTTADIVSLASDAGLDGERLRADMASNLVTEMLSKELALAEKLGVKGTPNFFINGRSMQGAQSIDRFRAVIEEELARAKTLVENGTNPLALYDELSRGDAPAEAGTDEPSCGCKGGSDDEPPVVSSTRETINIGSSPVKGGDRAPVTIVIFSDFECPFCAKADPRILALAERYPNKLKFVFKNQPLPMHEHARVAAKAGLAAADQGKFWEMHDVLFRDRSFARADLERMAQEIGLDLPKFRAALDGDSLDARLVADAADAMRLSVQGTPTFFVNGRRVIGAQPVEVFTKVIDEELSSSL